MKKPICIYHKNCLDGFGAAWAVWHKFGDDYEYHAAGYSDEPPEHNNREVLIVDFSYKKPVIEQMMANGSVITIIDHHKTAEADLMPLLAGEDPPPHGFDGIFDMSKSGAMLTWEWLHRGKEPPGLIKYIQDRDLWKFELDGTREIISALSSYPFDFKTWDALMLNHAPVDLYREGVTISRKYKKDLADVLGGEPRRLVIGGIEVPVVNTHPMFFSDIGHELSRNAPFAACYMDKQNSRLFSLRSADDGVDVSAIAKFYDGGGHEHAAGFEIPLSQLHGKGLL